MLQSQIFVPWVLAAGSAQRAEPAPGICSSPGEGRGEWPPPFPALEEKQKPFLTLSDNKATAIPLSQGHAKDPNPGQRKQLKNPPEKSYGGPVTPQTPADPHPFEAQAHSDAFSWS